MSRVRRIAQGRCSQSCRFGSRRGLKSVQAGLTANGPEPTTRIRSLIAPGQAQGARGGGGGGGGCGCGCPGGEFRMVIASQSAERRRPGDMGDATTRVGSIASRGGLSGKPAGRETGFKPPTLQSSGCILTPDFDGAFTCADEAHVLMR